MLRERERTGLGVSPGASGPPANRGAALASGDQRYNSSDCLLTLSGVATLPGPVWTYNGPPTYYWAASSNASYVPVGMKYWTGTNEPTWVAASERWYVYDGMVVVQERDKNNVPKVSYTRGLDLSGSRQGAGGIGGLLARSEHGTSSPYAISRTDCYHADGNGNITALVDTNSALSASYQYDPYGNVMSSSGAMKDANVYRFSSKMFHATSELYYYGYRFYDPNLQRWLSRDPIMERGGINLYRFVRNSPGRYVDRFGLTIRFNPSSPFPFIEHWRDCICKLMQSPAGRNLLLRAASPGIDIVINPDSGGPRSSTPYDNSDGTVLTVPTVPIGLDPDDPLGIGSQNRDVPPPDESVPSDLAGCAVVLAHELGHASEGEDDENEGGANVGLNENPVRRDFGIPLRRSYHYFPLWY